MSVALVTGGLGFIGSALARNLLERGTRVRIVDRVSDYYDPGLKIANADHLRALGAEIVQTDLAVMEIEPLLADVEVIYHQAGQPGVLQSWADAFPRYLTDNVLATQRLLEAAVAADTPRVVFASSSSIYGDCEDLPIRETSLPAPISPYGVTKLAAEHLVRLYATMSQMRAVALRYFTVYGPGQRPDMAFHRIIAASLGGDPFRVHGSGTQVRDFTFVDDIVEANLLAATADVPSGSVINLAGGSATSLRDAIATIAQLTGREIATHDDPAQRGDVKTTIADCSQARVLLDWTPKTPLDVGLVQQIAWQENHEPRS